MCVCVCVCVGGWIWGWVGGNTNSLNSSPLLASHTSALMLPFIRDTDWWPQKGSTRVSASVQAKMFNRKDTKSC